MKLWKDYFELLMKFEGEAYENDLDDPGGATKFGIDQRSHPGTHIRSLTKEVAEDIYLKEYWKCFAGDLPEPLCYVVYDFVVNAGESAAAKAMQRFLGVRVDGVVGPETWAAIKSALKVGGEKWFQYQFTAQRIAFYERLAKQKPRMKKFLRGWIKRAMIIDTWADGKRRADTQAGS